MSQIPIFLSVSIYIFLTHPLYEPMEPWIFVFQADWLTDWLMHSRPSKHETLSHCCFNVDPKLKQQWLNVSWLLGWLLGICVLVSSITVICIIACSHTALLGINKASHMSSIPGVILIHLSRDETDHQDGLEMGEEREGWQTRDETTNQL